MGLKENISSIKEEISTQEHFFESFFKIEKFYKKYKLILIGFGLTAIVGIATIIIMNFINEQNLKESNNAYNKVLTNSKDKANLEELKKINEKLYNIALFQISSDKTSAPGVEYLEDIAEYNDAVKKRDISKLDSLILKQDFLLKDFAIISKTLILIEKKEYNQAKITIAKIGPKSRVLPLSDMLQHFLMTK